MMPMFLQRSNGTVLATAFSTLLSGALDQQTVSAETRPTRSLPAIMRECLIGFRHAVHVFLLLDGRAAIVGGVQQLVGELVDHALLATAAGIGNQPADRKRGAPVSVDLDGHLVVGATDAPGLHFEQRLRILDRLLEQLQGFIAALGL